MPLPGKYMNIGILAHVDAGKTSISELLLYKSGIIRKPGSVDKGTSQTDWLSIEKERGISIRLATASFVYDDINFNIIDTPGHLDFSSEVERSLLALDCAVLVISAAESVQAHTDNIWVVLRKLRIPTLIFINKIDRSGVNINSVIDDVKNELTSDLIPFQKVHNEGEESVSITPITLSNSILKEAVIEKDENLLLKYLDGTDISEYEIINSLKKLISDNEIFPVLFGSAKYDLGIEDLMSTLSKFFPLANVDVDAEVEGVIYKVEHHKTIGKIASARLFKGILEARDNIQIQGVSNTNKISQIRKLQSNKYEDVGILYAGDTAALCGLKDAKAGDIIGNSTKIKKDFSLNTPLLTIKVSPQNTAEYSQLISAFQQLSDEDPSLELLWLKDEQELHIKVMGLVHIEILKSVLKSRFGMDTIFGNPTIIYKETPSKSGMAYEEYTMPKPCW
ncbi:MAG: GTP-binding protein, partial [Marinilabiliales bacterium]